jgi:hypothetical protein
MASDVEMDGDSLQSKARSLGLAHRVLDKVGIRDVGRLVSVCKRFLYERAQALVAKSRGGAILYSYSADGTPMLVQQTTSHRLNANTVFVRRAGAGAEFLLQQAFVVGHHQGGGLWRAFLTQEPVPMSEGKSAWHVFSCAARFFPLLRTFGHDGIILAHHCFDRGLESSVSRLMQQRGKLYYETQYGLGPREGQGALAELTDWHLSTGCACHDAHNSLKWGLCWLTGDSVEVMKRLHVAIESLRKGYDVLHRFLPSFVATHLTFVPSDSGDPRVLCYWLSLGLEQELAEELARLNLLWDGEMLLASVSCRDDPKVLERISTLLLGVFKFRRFTSSRWISVGSSCRTLTAALSLGLGKIVQLARADKGTSDYYIGGFKMLDLATTRWAIVASIASGLPDGFLVDLLRDDRLATRARPLWEKAVRELDRLATVEEYT